MQDFFGYNREIKSNDQIVSSEYAKIIVGSRVTLAQSVQWSYAHEVRPVFQVGDPTLYWVSGHAQGQIAVSRLVGKDGFLSNIKSAGSNCGRVSPVSISLDGGGACAVAGSGSITFDGALVEAVNGTIQSGSLELVEGFNIRVATMNAS